MKVIEPEKRQRPLQFEQDFPTPNRNSCERPEMCNLSVGADYRERSPQAQRIVKPTENCADWVFRKSPTLNAKGFSLMEMAVVLAVIGILSLVVFPNYLKFQLSAKNHTHILFAQTLQFGLESYLLDNGSYPSESTLGVVELVNKLKENGSLKNMQRNPYTGRPYSDADSSGKIIYEHEAHDDGYTISAYGKNNESVLTTLTPP